MPDKELKRLRDLRLRADLLLETLVEDLKAFRTQNDALGFRRTPTSTPDHAKDISVTTTCSCLMALTLFNKIPKFYGAGHKATVNKTLQNLINAPWKSSGLEENNAFTTTLVLRSYGFLRQAGFIDEKSHPLKKWGLPKAIPTEISFEKIAQNLAGNIDNFKIKTYPPASAVVYWFVDGIDRADFRLTKKGWLNLCEFAGSEFRRQRSLVTARHTAMMDPVAMAMAACLSARLHRIEKLKAPDLAQYLQKLPSMIELESSVKELFAEQTLSGLWPKYFPLFHYDDAGSNFCYTFELLEAVLLEFGRTENSTLGSEEVLRGLELAMTSCESGRLLTLGLEYGQGSGKAVPYRGWNSGGYLKTLQEAQPESWATAVVYMFLRELSDQLSAHIRERLLVSYGAHRDFANGKGLDEMVDIQVQLQGDDGGLALILKQELIQTFSEFKGDNFEKLLRQTVTGRLSALLFGPPGTSKTQVAKAIAKELRWPLVEIDPSRFLRNTFENLYVEAEEIFNDMMDLYGVVILFDELDALVQKRGLASQDTESTLLTTYMLPKLTKLHDRAHSIFMMATNFEDRFDDAIKRAGRFDLLLCMGPPSLEEKCDKLDAFLGEGKEIKKGGKLILKYAGKPSATYDKLTLYTYGDFRSFVKKFGDANDIAKELLKTGQKGFVKAVDEYSKSVGLRLSDLELLKESAYRDLYTHYPWEKLEDLFQATFEEEKIRKMNESTTPALRYILERKRSKFQ